MKPELISMRKIESYICGRGMRTRGSAPSHHNGLVDHGVKLHRRTVTKRLPVEISNIHKRREERRVEKTRLLSSLSDSSKNIHMRTKCLKFDPIMIGIHRHRNFEMKSPLALFSRTGRCWYIEEWKWQPIGGLGSGGAAGKSGAESSRSTGHRQSRWISRERCVSEKNDQGLFSTEFHILATPDLATTTFWTSCTICI